MNYNNNSKVIYTEEYESTEALDPRVSMVFGN